MLKLADLRKTTRRAANGDLRVVHPRFLRDRTLAPRIELATAYLESMLGRRRRDLDQEVVVQLFGDHKLARCIVASLAESYRYRSRTFAELLSLEQGAALAAQGIADPSGLRLWLYRRVNVTLAGFASAEERAPFLREAAASFGIAPDLFETLLTLDTPINAILTRSGSRPSADDVIARFNFAVAAALLANASLVRVSLTRIPRHPETVRQLCALAGVRGELAVRELVLHGQQDALNGWARYGARVVRLLSALLASGLPARSAEALVANPNGEDWLFRLDTEVLGYLGASSHSPQPAATDGEARDLETLLALWERSDALAADFAALRRAGQADDWTLRRAAAPLVVEGAVLPAFFTLSRGIARIPLVLTSASEPTHARLAATAARIPLVAVDAADGATLPDVPTLHYTGREDVAALPHLLARAAGEIERRAEEGKLAAALDEARRLGVVSEPRLATLLGCEEEEVALRLALPLARHTRQEPAMQYVEGFGLCRDDVLERARQAAADVAELRGDQPVGRSWVLRQLGRRLRQVTGASEGIECLIDYLGAA
ncbi:MAG TPA: DUF790 family protein [Ktedonobacterales bacterium]|nr:DUF790 family protein [Ktedonobacterales bacterium]